MLTAMSAAFYYIDETSFAHEEIDGYIPNLLLLKLVFGIGVAGLLLALVYPLTAIVTNAPSLLRRDSALSTQKGSSAYGRLLEKLLSLALYALAITAAYFVLRDPLDRAFLPLSGFGWVRLSFTYLYFVMLGLIGLLILRRLWELIGGSRTPAVIGQPAGTPDVGTMAGSGRPPGTDSSATVFCASCGSANPGGNQFCENCGERLGG